MNTNAKGAIITEMDATDLVGRLVINSHGAEFVVTQLTFNANEANIMIQIAEIDEETGLPDKDGECGLMNLNGFTIHQKLISR